MVDLLETQQIEIETLRERVRQLEKELCPPTVVVPIEWRLTPLEARIFAFLTTREVASKQSIMLAMYSDRVDLEPEIKIVDVVICKIRKKLQRFGVEIVTHWGHGYGLRDRASFSRSNAA